jgi:hypothetical protein
MAFLSEARVLTSVLSDHFSDDDDDDDDLSLSLSLCVWSHCRPHCCMDPVAEGHLTSHTLAVSICYLHVLPTIACCFSAWNVSPICSLLCLEWGAAFFRDLQFFAGYYWNTYGRIICLEVNL